MAFQVSIIFCLLVSFASFGQGFDYYYVDEYIRAQEDPDYSEVAKKREQEKKDLRVGVEDYKDLRFYEEQVQENSRQDYVARKQKQPVERDQESLAQKHEDLKQKEMDRYLEMQREYAQDREKNKQESPNYLSQNKRALASLKNERARIPKKDRKYKSRKSP